MAARRSFGQVFQRKGSSNWYVRFPDPDRPPVPGGRSHYVVRAVGPNEKDAKKLLAEIRKAMLTGAYAPPKAAPDRGSDGLTVGEAVAAYIDAASPRLAPNSIERYRGSLLILGFAALATKRVAEVGTRDIEAFLAWRREHLYRARTRPGKGTDVVLRPGRTATGATLLRDLLLLNAAFGRLARLGVIRDNVLSGVPRPRAVKRSRVALSKTDARRLVDACEDPTFRTLVLAALLTGARRGELTRLTWGDVNHETGSIALFRPKVGNASTIPLHPVLADELRRLRAARARAGKRVIADSESIFLSDRGNPWWDMKRAWNAAVKRAKLDGRRGLVFHSLRHTFATHFLENGGAVTDLQGILGHSTLGTTAIYARMVDVRARASLFAMDFGLGRRARVLEGGMRTNCVPPRPPAPAVLRKAAGSDLKPRKGFAPVEATGLEPVTYDLQSRCSTN